MADIQHNGLLDRPFFILTGPTASGKSALALALAQALAPTQRLEIVSVDSALVYQGMDIGTAKPTRAERAQVPHHLIDIRAPQHSYSVAEFLSDCLQCIDQILARGAFPLLVGGTLMYLQALLHGLDALPPADAAVRAELEARAQRQGWPALHAWLAQVDPATAARLAPRDAQRIQRALEVWQLTGQPLSQLQQRTRQAQPGLADWIAQRMLSVEPAERAWLHQRVAQRFAQMLQDGFLDEVRALRANPLLHAQLPSMRAVGYRQAWQMLDGQLPADAWVAQAEAATRQLAKRQMTWLRSMPSRQVLHSDQLTAEQMLQQALPRLQHAIASAADLP